MIQVVRSYHPKTGGAKNRRSWTVPNPGNCAAPGYQGSTELG